MAGLVKCKACGEEVAKGAKCPKCGKDNRSWPARHKFLTVIGVIILLAIVGSAMGSSSSGDDDSPSKPVTADGGGESSKDTAKADSGGGAPVVVQAGAIIKEFEGNEAAADKKYRGKRVQVSGVLDKVDTDILDEDNYVLNIGSGGDFELIFVRCADFDASEVESLNSGDKVTVVGDFDDGGDLGVDLKDCESV